MGKDSGTGHAVSTCDYWLFDSNLPNAQIINNEILNWCCSTDEEKVNFKKVFWCMRLFPQPEFSKKWK